jgi:hypothetical protein
MKAQGVAQEHQPFDALSVGSVVVVVECVVAVDDGTAMVVMTVGEVALRLSLQFGFLEGWLEEQSHDGKTHSVEMQLLMSRAFVEVLHASKGSPWQGYGS